MVSRQDQGSGHISAVLVSAGLIKALQILIISHFSSTPVITHLNHSWDTGAGDVLGTQQNSPCLSLPQHFAELTFPQQLEKTAVGPDYLQRTGRSQLHNLDLTLKLSLELGFHAWMPGLVWRLLEHSDGRAEAGEAGEAPWELNPWKGQRAWVGQGCPGTPREPSPAPAQPQLSPGTQGLDFPLGTIPVLLLLLPQGLQTCPPAAATAPKILQGLNVGDAAKARHSQQG